LDYFGEVNAMINNLELKASTAGLRFAAIVAFVSLLSLQAFGQTNATLRGTVTLGESGKPIHHVIVTIMQLKRTVGTDEQGNYEFKNLPPGRYDVLAHLDRVPDPLFCQPHQTNLKIDKKSGGNASKKSTVSKERVFDTPVIDAYYCTIGL
jgi:hypothetical protein